MRPHNLHAPLIAGRRGFTLVELLVAITIMAILAAMVSGALIVARASARAAATKATVAKLHNVLMTRWESYRTRRVPLSDQNIYSIAVNYYGHPSSPPNQPVPPRLAALIRLAALRDIMRMEMPERWTDVQNDSIVLIAPGSPPTRMPRPSLSQAYLARYAANPPQTQYAPAKCLYLVVMMSGGEDVRRQFQQNEIATDSDGYSMFIDGWGHPIYFLRWAPAFNDSDLQLNLVDQSDLDATSPGNEIACWTSANVLVRRQQAAQDDHDPFDPRKVDMVPSPTPANPPRGWRLYPLVYSPGPDGEYGIALDSTSGAYVWVQDHYLQGFGLPVRASGNWVHFDNVHNHRIGMETE